jgi:Spy/CpxP family protein refolding chaperone
MRKVLMLAVLAALLVAPVVAQQPGFFGRGFGGNDLTYLSNKGVQEELKLTDKQKEEISAIQKKQREMFGGGKGKGKFDPEKFKEVMEATTKAVDKFKDGLKPEQKTRLAQIKYQQMGAAAFLTEDVQKALKLTDKQKDEFKEIADETQKDAIEVLRGAGRDQEKRAEAAKKVAKLNKEATDKISKSLNDNQKKAWKDLLGTPFDYKPEPFRFGKEKGKDI